MAMQAFDYRLGGPNVPHEGDLRAQWVAEADALDYQIYRNGRWEAYTRIRRGELYPPMNAYQQAALRHQNPLYQGAYNWRVVDNANVTSTTATPNTEAIARAEQLLLSHLNPEQIVQFKADGWFETIGGATKRTYRVGKKGWPGKNVVWMENGRDRISYCAYPTGHAYLPVGDVMLAQKMALEDAEGETRFTTMACWVDHISGVSGGAGFVHDPRIGRTTFGDAAGDVYWRDREARADAAPQPAPAEDREYAGALRRAFGAFRFRY